MRPLREHERAAISALALVSLASSAVAQIVLPWNDSNSVARGLAGARAEAKILNKVTGAGVPEAPPAIGVVLDSAEILFKNRFKMFENDN